MHKLIKKFLIDYKEINKCYNFFLEKKVNIDNTNQILVDNYHLIEDCKKNITIDKKNISKELKESTRIYSLIEKIVLKNNYNISYELLVTEIVNYQNENNIYFTYKELSQTKNILVFIYINKLKELYNNNYNNFKKSEEVSKIIEKTKINDNNFIELIDKQKIIKRDYKYIFEINNQLNNLGENSNFFFKRLNNYLEENNISLKEVINEQYQEKINYTILVSNIFSNIKEFLEYSRENLFVSINKCEKILMTDKIYSNMTKETKEGYRLRISKLAHKKKLSEFEYVKNLFEELDYENSHIGNILFTKKTKEYNTYIYLFIMIFLSVIITFVLSNYFLKSRILSFIILFIPVIYIVIQLINQIVLLNDNKLLSKMDFKNKVTDKQKTMIVINDTITNINKLKDVFENLESFYLTNRSDNLYFSLLVDFDNNLNEDEYCDEKLSTFAIEYVKQLNEKYKKNIFYFAFQKNKSLTGFNKLLLHKLKKQELKEYFFDTTFEKFNEDIKYVIILDSNTRPKLNSLLQLISVISHPLNKAVLNKDNTKVIDGYAIMQPSVSNLLELKNKSIFSKIFSDIYEIGTSIFLTPNIEQKLFKKSTFLGIGIYDLEVLDEVFLSKQSDETILNSNLIKGDILRCAYLPNVSFNYKFSNDYLEMSLQNKKSLKSNLQLIPYLFQKNKDKSTFIPLITKLKIIGSITKVLLYISLLLVIIVSFIFTKNVIVWLLFILFIFLLRLKTLSKSRVYNNHKQEILTKLKLFPLRIYTLFATLPYLSSLYINLFFTTIYELIFHKKLTIKKVNPKSKFNYLLQFHLNFIIGLILITISIIKFNLIILLTGLIYIISPFIIKLFSKDIKVKEDMLRTREKEEVNDIAKKTWNYFLKNLESEYDYLIPDNYQEIKDENKLLKTSPSDIAFSLTSVICAHSLEFIDLEKTFFYLENILESISSLEKWNGHLYNCYDIKNKKVLSPRFISTLDSANLSASLITTLEFLKVNNNKRLVDVCEKLINNMDYNKLYTKDGILSIGYDEDEKELSTISHNSLISGTRLANFIAISKGDISSEEWFLLDRTQINYKKQKGLISEKESISSCYTPNLFMKNYKNTLLDESYSFMHLSQKSYIENIDKKLPFGLEKDLYDEINDLKITKKKDSLNKEKIIIYPYISLMIMDLYPSDVYKNVLKFKKLNMLSKYGFYDFYNHSDKKIVRTFSSKHQGMILISLTNYLKDDVIKKYFHKNIKIKAFSSLLKEETIKKQNSKILYKTNFKNYKLPSKQNLKTIKDFSSVDEIGVLSNKRYTLLMNKEGNSFSRYQTLQLNRYRKNTYQDYGMFLYIKDLKSNKIWSNTYAPINIEPDNYEFSFSNDSLKLDRKDGEVRTKTEIIVSNTYNAEIRKITFFNNSNEIKELELTTYTEPILLENIEDISDKVVNSMFLKSEIIKSTNSLVVKRNIRDYNSYYMVNKLFIENPQDKYSYETNRLSFIGRGNDYSNPIAITKDLSNQTGDMLDGILSIRNRIKIEANSKEVVYFISGFGRSIEQINDIVNTYNDKKNLEKEFELVEIENSEKKRLLNIDNIDIKSYNTILNNLYKNSITRENLLKNNKLQKKHLLKFGVSGNYPIILLAIKGQDFELLSKFLKAFEYFKNKSLFIDFVFINNEDDIISKILKKQIDDELYRIYATNSFYHTPGSVYVIDFNDINEDEKHLLEVSSNIYFDLVDNLSFCDYIKNLENSYKINYLQKQELLTNEKLDSINNICLDNTYGGFRNNGAEYVINNKNTPTPWSNVISNGCFGTVITNNGCGYSFCYNSLEYRLTSCTNELVINEKSEGIKINGKAFDPQRCIHGFGYSILEGTTKDLEINIEELVATRDNVKMYILKLTNRLKQEQNLDLSFYINPTLGNYKEETNRYIYSEFIKNNNYLKLKNTYNDDYSDINVFLSSTEKIENVISNNSLFKEIITKIKISGLDTKTLVFTLGCCKNDQELSLVNKYMDINNCFIEKDAVKEKWRTTLNKITVKTPDESLNYMLNGWSLYQTISSRLMAKASFYQASGISNYRESLQDAMNICLIDPLYTKTQILNSAAHQFIDGDVLHVFKENTNIGLRSRHKDDYLWLVYVTMYYLEVTDDYEILDEEIEFIEGDELTYHEIEREITFTYTNNKENLFKHCTLAIEKAIKELGKHNLPLIGNGDFDDDLNEIGIRGSGESVLLGFFLYDIINKFIKVIKRYDSLQDISKYEEFNKGLLESLNKYGYENDHYLRAYFDNGDKLGSFENDEYKIDLLSQSFSILSEVVNDKELSSIISNIDNNLVDSEENLIKSFSPAFEKSLNVPGRIMKYPKGVRKNGSQCNYSLLWYVQALIKNKDYDKAYRYYQMINPINRTDIEKYMKEPYIIAEDIYSNNSFKNQGGFTWNNSASSLFYRVGIEEILGIKRCGDKLMINPHLPKNIKEFEISYTYLDALYDIKVRIGKDEKILINSKKISTNYILLENKGKYNVEVYSKD